MCLQGQVLPSWRIAVEEQKCESPWMGPLLHPLLPPWAGESVAFGLPASLALPFSGLLAFYSSLTNVSSPPETKTA